MSLKTIEPNEAGFYLCACACWNACLHICAYPGNAFAWKNLMLFLT